jgi:hypothetical protein
MARWFDELREMFSPTLPDVGGAADEDSQSHADNGARLALIVERLYSFPEFVEIWTSSPSPRRLPISIESNTQSNLVEMSRGVPSLFVNLTSSVDDDCRVKWHDSNGGARTVRLTRESLLNPTFTSGTKVYLNWSEQELPRVRIRVIRWVDEAARVEPTLSGLIEVDSKSSPWQIPLDWVGPEPVEIRVTPIADDRQGLTEQIILPPRNPRIEGVFERVMLEVNGAQWRRLQLTVRTPPSVQRPSVVHVDWIPFDSAVAPASFHVDWPSNASSVCIPFASISMRGDRLVARLEYASSETPPVVWFAVDAYNDTNKTEVLLTEGAGAESQQVEYVHRNLAPNGPMANILVGNSPLSQVDGLSLASKEAIADLTSFPSTLIWCWNVLSRDVESIGAAARIRGLNHPDLRDFSVAPQQYILYSRERCLRSLAIRCPQTQCDSTIGHLVRYCDEKQSQLDRDSLRNYWETADDAELDRWVEAAAAGASIARLSTRWRDVNWRSVELHVIVETARHLEHVRAEPLQSLLPHLIHDCDLARRIEVVANDEARLSSVTPAEFHAIQLSRETVLATMASHWSDCTQGYIDDRYARISQLLCRRPASAAQELESLSQDPTIRWNARGHLPVFVVEQQFVDQFFRERSKRESLLSMGGDWCRVLFERQFIPSWPWFGTLPSDWDSSRLLDCWNTDVFPHLTNCLQEATPPDPVFLGTLERVYEIALTADHESFRDLITTMRQHSSSLFHWTNHQVTRD